MANTQQSRITTMILPSQKQKQPSAKKQVPKQLVKTAKKGK